MKTALKLVSTILILATLAGCATTSSPAGAQPERTRAVIHASKDKVWPLLVSEVGLNYPVAAIEKESGLITTAFVSIPVGPDNMYMNRYVIVRPIFLATWNGLRGKLSVLAVETAPGQTQVTITAHYEAYESNVLKTTLVMPTNGVVENRILSSIEQKLGISTATTAQL
ncbi:MAG: hypothetical protein ACREIA_05560 [Opitutaceae bacterium]